MPSFNAGDVVNITLDSDDVLTFNGAGSCSVTQPNGEVSSIRLNSPYSALGPFATGVSLSITCSTAGSYSKKSTNSISTVGEILSLGVTASTTLGISALDTVVDCNSGSAIVLTIPPDITLGIENSNDRRTIAAYQAGAGAVSFAAGAGVTLRGTAPTAAQYTTVGIMRVGANEWAYL